MADRVDRAEDAEGYWLLLTPHLTPEAMAVMRHNKVLAADIAAVGENKHDVVNFFQQDLLVTIIPLIATRLIAATKEWLVPAAGAAMTARDAGAFVAKRARFAARVSFLCVCVKYCWRRHAHRGGSTRIRPQATHEQAQLRAQGVLMRRPR